MTTPNFNDYNIHSVTKTKLYRTIRERIKVKIPSMSETDIRSIAGPLVQRHVDQASQRKEAMDIALSVLGELNAANLVVQAGGKVVAKGSEASSEASSVAPPKKRKRTGGPKPKTAAETADFTSLMESFVLCYHEKNMDKPTVAQALGVSPSSVGNWLTKDGFPSRANANAIAKFVQSHNYASPKRFS